MSDSEASAPLPKKPRTDEGGGEGVGTKVEGGSQSPPAQVAKEEDVGISQFVSDHEGFFAVLKRRLARVPVYNWPAVLGRCGALLKVVKTTQARIHDTP